MNFKLDQIVAVSNTRNRRIAALSVITFIHIFVFTAMVSLNCWSSISDSPAQASANGDDGLATRGFDLAVDGDLSKSIETLREAVRVNPKDWASLENLGHALLLKSEIDDAITNLNEAIKLNPQSESAYDIPGMAYSSKGQFDKAITNFDEALRISPKNARALNNRGVTHSKKGDFVDAIKDFDVALGLEPRSSRLFLNRAQAYRGLRQWSDASADLTTVIQADVNNIEAYNALAWLLCTCPDSSIRNGDKASDMAWVACELSRWQKWYCIGTLAAARAEAGAFDDAVKYQKQAMALSGVTANDKLEMQKKLELYQAKKPFHEPNK